MVLKFQGEDITATKEGWRHLFYGPAGTGKSRMITTIPLWLLHRYKNGEIPYEAIKVWVLDFDGGIMTNLDPYPPEYKKFFTVYQIFTYSDIEEAVNEIIEEVKNYQQEYNIRPYVAIDNIEHWWQMTQDQWIEDAYGMNYAEFTKESVKSIMDENAPTLSLNIFQDWRAITKMMEYNRDKIYNSGANVVITSTAKEVSKLDKKTGVYQLVGMTPNGQRKDREGYPFHFVGFTYISIRMDNVEKLSFKIAQEEINAYWLILTKNRAFGKKKKWKNERINFYNYMQWITKGIKEKQQSFMVETSDLFEQVMQGLAKEKGDIEEDDSVQAIIEQRKKEVQAIAENLDADMNTKTAESIKQASDMPPDVQQAFNEAEYTPDDPNEKSTDDLLAGL